MAKPFSSLSPAGDLTSPLISFRGRPPFTASQWQELETQALVFKYFVAGVPVPDDLLSAVRVSFESIAAARFYHQSSLGYGGYFGKKIDPEPGRCRRTDGKKWRCAKEAAPDSKYCERHMHRGRNRSRKPVESQQLNHNNPNHNNNTTNTATTTANTNSNGSSNSGGMNLNQMNEAARSVGIGSRGFGNPGNGNPGNGLYLNMDASSYRYPYGVVKNIDEQSLFSEASGTLRCITMGSSQPSNHFSPYQLQNNNNNNNNSFFNNNNDNYSRNVGPTKEHNLRHFFDENDYSFSSTQLSISIPMTGSEFSTPSSRSPDDD